MSPRDDYGQQDQLDDPADPRPYGSRPYGSRPYGSRPYGSRPYGSRPYGSRPYGSRPYGSRPYGSRPYGSRPYGSRDDDGNGDGPGGLDPEEWSADVAEMFCDASAVVRLGARIVVGDQIRVPNVNFANNGGRYLARPLWNRLGPAVTEEILRPSDHELVVTIAIANRLASALGQDPDLGDALKQDLANELALIADRAFLAGGGPGPVGIRGRQGTNATVPVAGDLLATGRAMVTTLRRQRALFRRAGWILSLDALQTLSETRTETGLTRSVAATRSLDSGRLLTYDSADGGSFLGLPYVATPAAGPGTRAYLSSDWSEAWIGVEDDLVTVAIATELNFTADQTIVRAVMRQDFGLRRPAYFSWF